MFLKHFHYVLHDGGSTTIYTVSTADVFKFDFTRVNSTWTIFWRKEGRTRERRRNANLTLDVCDTAISLQYRIKKSLHQHVRCATN